MATIPLPPLPRYIGPDPVIREWSDRMCATIEIWSRNLQFASSSSVAKLQADFDAYVATHP